ncbi:MAG TPA: hypothetical protein VKF59_16305 [Candidatus Dormibacteraeota bacterium]|nr:hypothetical protein [Candidatus Dormibacteraeota bacterium]
MGDIERYRERVEAARRQVTGLPRDGWGEPGPPDAETGERWDRGHVLGHVAEMLPYWTAQVGAVLEGAGAMGRDELGYAQRRRAIDGSRDADADALLGRIDVGLKGLLGLLERMTDADLERPLLLRGDSGPREVPLRVPIEQMLVGHVEAHLHQLAELG